uniref:Uncharacterized protein n=1 Tax=Phytophthora fragariae TaxID=53985 RepID=A0A6A3DI89_9STRA|nr:hypothetical protein PF009_g31036 [Phytophthora fragariae]
MGATASWSRATSNVLLVTTPCTAPMNSTNAYGVLNA